MYERGVERRFEASFIHMYYLTFVKEVTIMVTEKPFTYPQIGGITMKHVIVYAHPNTESFNHAILETVKMN